MATDTSGGEDQCRMVLEAALMECGEEATRHQLEAATGVEDVDCDLALMEGLTEPTCQDTAQVRAWVMCRAFELVTEEMLKFGDALTQAWSEATEKCSAKGVPV